MTPPHKNGRFCLLGSYCVHTLKGKEYNNIVTFMLLEKIYQLCYNIHTNLVGIR